MNSFTIYKEYYELITLLSEKEQQELLLVMTKYMFENKEPNNLNDKQRKIFINLKRALDKSKNRGKCGAKTKSNENQNEIKMKSKQNQNEIKLKSNEEQKENTSNDVNVNVNNYDNNYVVNVDVNNNLFNYIETNFGRTLTPIEYEIVSKWEDNELTRYAIKESVLNRAFSIKYIQAIIDKLKAKGISKLEEIEKKGNNITPSWVGKEHKAVMATQEEIDELDRLMKEALQ